MASDENIWANLNPKTISDNPSQQVNQVTQPIHLEKANKQALEATVLINNALLRADNAIIPGTMKIVSVNGGTEASTPITLYEPNEGELWRVLDISAERTGSGTTNYYPRYYDNVEDVNLPILDLASSDGEVQFDTWPESAVFVDSRVSIGIYHQSGTVTAMAYRAVIGQIR